MYDNDYYTHNQHKLTKTKKTRQINRTAKVVAFAIKAGAVAYGVAKAAQTPAVMQVVDTLLKANGN